MSRSAYDSIGPLVLMIPLVLLTEAILLVHIHIQAGQLRRSK